MILFINACVREGSRTKRLADYLLEKLREPVNEVKVWECSFPAADQRFLTRREKLVQRGELDHPVLAPARQFAGAETIVVAAPYWDMSFPAALKQYFEQINVVGVTFSYSAEGVAQGLCRAKRLYYVTTSGGALLSPELGYGYVKALAEGFYQIPEIRLIKAEGLDIPGADTESIMSQARESIDKMLAE